jgi:hypothetical protein
MSLIRTPDERGTGSRNTAGTPDSADLSPASSKLQEAAMELLQAVANQQEQRRRLQAKCRPLSNAPSA